jgi:hypothetical protein
MNTEQTYDSNEFRLGNSANPQEIRSSAANFNKFLEPSQWKRNKMHWWHAVESSLLWTRPA